jgi:RHS repeat-associated protein
MRTHIVSIFLVSVLGSWLQSSATPAQATSAEPTRPVLKLPANPSTEDLGRARIFEEPLVPVGNQQSALENAALAKALVEYSRRAAHDDFSALTQFLKNHPDSPWAAALLTVLGLEYYNSAYYSRALEAWREAWALGQNATNLQGKFLADRAACELAGLYSRLGRMNDLETLLKSLEQRVFLGGATERISMAREALWMMQNQPAISFRCGPLALQRILLSNQSLLASAATNAMMDIFNSASTQQGFSLVQVAELSKQVGLNYQMAFREKGGDFVVPSVVHWKVGHYAAMVRQVGDQYLLEDPTFGNTVWATKRALQAETSGYFLIPSGDLPGGWRKVDAKEGATVWGKGVTSGNDQDIYTPEDLQTGNCGGPRAEDTVRDLPPPSWKSPFGLPFGTPGGTLFGRGGVVRLPNSKGMAVSSVHLMLANLQVRDTPVGYTPPVGPPVPFTVRYNHRDYLQPPSLISSIFGPKWSHDWQESIRDNPNNPRADVKYFVGGGGARTFSGFDTNTQSFAMQQFDHTRLTRIGTNIFTSSYEMLFPDGSKKVFGLRVSGSLVFLTQIVDPAGNTVTLTWADPGTINFRLVALTDAIGQVTTISYEHPSGQPLITKITDPFGRFATFEYATYSVLINNQTVPVYILNRITDVLGLVSRFEYVADFMQRMITPYGTNTFTLGNGGSTNATMRFVETRYADGSRDRVEFNQSDDLGIASQEPNSAVPQAMAAFNSFLYARNTYYWSRNACAMAYGDYTKAQIYHWLHSANLTTTSGILESVKNPLERRVWYDYDAQAGGAVVGRTDQPRHVGRVLDDGTTQLYTYEYNPFGHVTRSIDPMGRTMSYVYDTNAIDLVEIRQTRAGNNELLFRATYDTQHQPLTIVDTAGQTNTYSYNARGQLLTATNPKNETITFTYDINGYLITIDGPLPETNDVVSATYDAFGRMRTITGVSGYTRTNSYDALDRLTQVTYPDSTFTRYTYSYDRFDLIAVMDRARRETRFEYDNVGQVRKVTDPLGRETLLSWCRCGAMKSLIDPMGRVTEWHMDLQGRVITKQYSDGSKISFSYENTTSRLRQVIDEKQQVAHYAYNRDDTLASMAYVNAAIPTPPVSFTYDPNYERVLSMTDGTGTTLYSYNPITATPTLGAGELASIDGPLPDDTLTVEYDELGREVSGAINGVSSAVAYDAAGRITTQANALGTFTYSYDGNSARLAVVSLPNGQIGELSYGGNLLDQVLQRMTHRVAATAISEFLYGHDVPAGRVTTWSQQSGSQSPFVHTYGYDEVNQLLSATVTNAGALVSAFTYSYDLVGNRLSEQVDATNRIATYNSLNQITTSTAPSAFRTNEWDADDRLSAVTIGNRRTEFTYDGSGRRIAIRHLINGSEVSHRHFLWCGSEICEERDATGVVVKRFFPQGVKIETGPVTGTFYYTYDHLGSIRELTDSSGNVRARYAYDPYGRRTKVGGDLDADFGFAGMFWSPEANLSLTLFRAYDPELGRWLSRDPLGNAEVAQGPNLYAYVANDPINLIDPFGLMWGRLMNDGDWEIWVRAHDGKQGEIVEVENVKRFVYKPRAKPGELMLRPKPGELALRLKVEPSTPRFRRPYPAPPLRVRPPALHIPRARPPNYGGLYRVPSALLDAGMKILTMANCDTIEGIFGIMRVRRGELLNKYENEMMKELNKEMGW